MSDTGAEQPNLGIPGIDSVVEIGRKHSHTTYRVRDVARSRTVVVKLLNAGRDWPGLAERFDREQSALSQLVGHPNIVPVYGHGWTETGMPYIVSGEETGGSIGDRLRGPTPMTGPDIVSLGVRLAGALESAHRAGVVHGDLRPDDIMLTPEGEPLVADFALVSLVRPNAADVTDPNELAHVAPELLDGSPATPASDIYALASALYTLLAGEPAFVHASDTSIVPAIKRIASDPLPDLTSKNVPPAVVEAVTKAMSKSPSDRYRTAADFGRALQQSQVALGLPMTDMTLLGSAAAAAAATTFAGAAAGGGAPGGPSAAGGAGGAGAGAPGGPGGPGGPGDPSATPPSKSRTPVFIAIGVAAVVLIAAIAFLATRGGGSGSAAKSDSSSSSTKKSKSSSSTDTDTDTDTDTTDAGTDTDASADTVDLSNDSAQIFVTVPTTWTQTNTKNNATSNVPELQASTNLTEFLAGTYMSPGVDAALFTPAQFDPTNLDAVLDSVEASGGTGAALGTVCTHGTRQDTTTMVSGFTARTEVLTACNGGGDVQVLAATDSANSFVLAVEIHFGVPPDNAGAQLALDSIDVVA